MLLLVPVRELAGPPSPEHALLIGSLAALRPDGCLYRISPRDVALPELCQHVRCGLYRVEVGTERALRITQANEDLICHDSAIITLVKVDCLLHKSLQQEIV